MSHALAGRGYTTRSLALACALCFTSFAHRASVGGTVSGNCWFEMVKGRPGPSTNYVPLYEWNLHLSRDGGTAQGQAFRVGAGQSTQSFYTFAPTEGTYSMLLDRPKVYGRPKVVRNIHVPPTDPISFDIQWTTTDYICAFGSNSSPWGSNPWTVYDSTWYQTFIATGTSITGVSYKVAGSNATSMVISILQDNGGPITTWPVVGAARLKNGVGSGDQWVRYRSGQILTTPGTRYALKLAGIGGTYAIWRRWEDNFGYAGGQAFNSSGTAQPFDVYAIVFSDNDGTVIPYANVLDDDAAALAGFAQSWSQEIVAMGNSLAGANVMFAGESWSIPIIFRVHSDSPTGPQIGPAKTGPGAFESAPNAGVAGVSWEPGEVPLTLGQKYYLEVSNTTAGDPGLNPFKFGHSDNYYPQGDAFMGSARQPGVNLFMQVVEYAATPPPAIGRTPTSFTRTVARKGSLSDTTFTLSNNAAGCSLLNYTLSSDAAWLSATPTSGACNAETDTITMKYNVATVIAGSYVGTLTIQADEAAPQTVVVNLTVLPPPFAFCDFDHDRDVDQEDFGRFQRCLTGQGVDQTDGACAGALLDNDTDVDQNDMDRFLNCLGGPGIVVSTSCSDQ